MADPADYLVAAAVTQMRAADNSALETLDDLKNAVEKNFPAYLEGERLNYLARMLESYGFITVTTDEYAGDYITPLSGWGVSYRLNKIKEADPKHGIIFALDRGYTLIERAFSNEKFWSDLDAKIASQGDTKFETILDNPEEIPASDRIVSLSHNQFKEIDEGTAELLEALERDNGIPENPGLKERLVGQINAGRELLRAGEFQLAIFQATMLSGLKEVSDRYGDHVIGAAASALMTLILHVLEIPGF